MARGLEKSKGIDSFIEDIEKTFPNCFDLSKFNYVNVKTKSIVTCKRCSKELLRTSTSLLKFGCLNCDAKQRASGSNIYTKAFKNDQNPDTYKCLLYVIEFSNEIEKFIKIGITTNTVSQRFKKTKYNMKIHLILDLTLTDALKHEKDTLKEFMEFKYNPLISFNGKQECLEFNCLENVITALLARNGQEVSSLIAGIG